VGWMVAGHKFTGSSPGSQGDAIWDEPVRQKKYPDWRDAGREGTGVSRVEGKSITLIQLHES
jgi:hypothetical protein